MRLVSRHRVQMVFLTTLAVALLLPMGAPASAAPSAQGKLVASDGAANDYFGFSVAVWGDTAVVGAIFDDARGSAYVFTRIGGTWTQQTRLVASDGAPGDAFGSSVAIEADTVVVGAAYDDVGANADQGSTYVFVRSGGTWIQQAHLTADDGAANDQFGTSVGLSRDTVIVGAPKDDVGANVNQGTAYVYSRSGATWTPQAQLTATGGAANDGFGASVACSGDTIVVGADSDDVGPSLNQGSAYIYTRTGITWSQQHNLVAVDGAADDGFGASVALSGRSVVVGAPGDDVGANPDQGSAYLYTNNGISWSDTAHLISSDGGPGDHLGSAVAISADIVVLGSPSHDLGANPDQGSAYVFTYDGSWTQQSQLSASDGGAGDHFGISVALSGDTALIGAHLDDVHGNVDQGAGYGFLTDATPTTNAFQRMLIDHSGATGDTFGDSVAVSGATVLVGASRADVGTKADAGSAYVFLPDSWTRLTASDGDDEDYFGSAVSLSGDTAVIGAPQHDVGANANQGSVYVFTRTGDIWSQQAELIAGDGDPNDGFGRSVAISGNTLVVGAEFDDIGGNGHQGSAYVFTRSGSTWTQQAKLTASDGAADEQFGSSVAISGESIVVGAHLQDVGANAEQGSAYVFARAGSSWTQQARLTASDGEPYESFGFSVGISGSTAVVGALMDDAAGSVGQGSAYVFIRSGSTWTQEAKLTAPNGAANDYFGGSVSISGDTVVVGMASDDIGGTTSRGSAYVFTRSGTTWALETRLIAADGDLNDYFGSSVAVSGGTVAIGAFADDIAGSTGRGSAYVFWLFREPTVGAQDPTTGLWYLRNSAGVETQFYYGNPGDIPFVGDWDCDGTDTPGLFRQSDAYAYLRNSNTQGNADIRFFFGNPSDVPLAGDFDGDGCDTLSIYRPTEQRFYIINRLGQNEGGLGAAEYFFTFGNPGDQPVVGDWDGDGVDEIGLYRESSGFFYYRNTLTTGIADGQFYFGNPGDRFVAGDWGITDGRDTPAVFRPSTRIWYFRHTLTQGNADHQDDWGEASWQPVAGTFGLDEPPGPVTGVAVGTGGGSGEISVTWNAHPEPDVTAYDVYYSGTPGGTYTWLTQVPAGTPWPGDGRIGFIDYPRDLAITHCYQVGALDAGGNSGPRSTEACFSGP